MSKGTATRPDYLFDRPRGEGRHPWGVALAEMAEHADPGRCLVAENWCMDHRVSPPREEAMLASGHFHGRPDAEAWWAQRGEHFARSLCLPVGGSPGVRGAAYAEAENGNNLVPAGKLPGHNRLLHLASLNRILWRLSSAEHADARLKLGFLRLTGRSLPQRPASGSDAPFNLQVDEIAAELEGRGEEAVRELAGLLADALGPSEPVWWAGFDIELNGYLKEGDWYRLCLALGLGHLDRGEWLLAWRYPVAKAGPLYRPTVVEANDNPCHFPSPPGFAYGVTMPLAKGLPACREVVHAPLKGETAREACTGRLGRIAAAPVMTHNHLPQLRNSHRERLRREHPGACNRDWLVRHPSTPPSTP